MGSRAAMNSPLASSTITHAKMPSSAFQISLVSPSFCACGRHLHQPGAMTPGQLPAALT